MDGGQVKYKTLFRLMVKAVGLMLVGHGVLWAALGVAQLISWYLEGALGMQVYFGTSETAAGLLLGAWGAYLFFGGRWIVDLAIPSNRPYCPECAYDLTGAPGGRCPECGTPFTTDDVRPPAAVSESKGA